MSVSVAPSVLIVIVPLAGSGAVDLSKHLLLLHFQIGSPLLKVVEPTLASCLEGIFLDLRLKLIQEVLFSI